MTAGDRLGPYEILAPVGAGGMGEVYKTRDTRLDRIVAIKISQEQFSERFECEARAVAALNHPHICQLFDVGPNYLVMEFVEGEPLKGPLPVAKAVEYAGQILEALNAAHRKGIVHRDLKPANILLTKQGIKLLDFGLAKQSGPLDETDVTRALTQQGQIVGTLQYMSPEQLQGKEADARSDLFAFGCVLYEMLTGKQAFEGKSAASVIASILERDPATLNLSPPLERVIQACLAKDPDHRFQNALDVKRDLVWALEQPSASRTDRRAWIAVTVATLVIGALSGWAISHFLLASADVRVLRLQINPPPGGRFVVAGATAFTFGGFTISPDSKTAAFVGRVNEKTALWVRPLDTGSARMLPGTEDASYPMWSPDSRSIAFIARNKVERVQIAGGPPSIISDTFGGSQLARGGSWGGDGYIIFGVLNSGIFRVPASGGTPVQLTALDASRGEISHSYPQLLPDGRFLFTIRAIKREMDGVYAASLAKPTERLKVLDSPGPIAAYVSSADGSEYLVWTRGGMLVAQHFNARTLKTLGQPLEMAGSAEGPPPIFSVSGAGSLLYGSSRGLNEFMWFERSGRPLTQVGESQANFMFRISPDGSHIIAQRGGTPISDLWLLDTSRGLASRLTATAGTATHPVWSPDGRTILFDHLGTGTIIRKPSNGTGDESTVMQRPPSAHLTDWSGDGRWVMEYEIAPETNYDLWLLPVTLDGKRREGDKPKPYLRTAFNERFGRFSPGLKTRWVAYQSDESGQYEIYIDAFPEPRGKIRISTAGGVFPEWSGTGGELFYMSPDFNLMAVALKEKGDSLEPSAPQKLFSILPGTYMSPYQVSRDGQRFLVLSAEEQAAQPLNIIVNWPALLMKPAQ